MLSDPAWIGWANTKQGFVPHKLHAEMTGFPVMCYRRMNCTLGHSLEKIPPMLS